MTLKIVLTSVIVLFLSAFLAKIAGECKKDAIKKGDQELSAAFNKVETFAYWILMISFTGVLAGVFVGIWTDL